jgi:hypothetical protein
MEQMEPVVMLALMELQEPVDKLELLALAVLLELA